MFLSLSYSITDVAKQSNHINLFLVIQSQVLSFKVTISRNERCKQCVYHFSVLVFYSVYVALLYMFYFEDKFSTSPLRFHSAFL